MAHLLLVTDPRYLHRVPQDPYVSQIFEDHELLVSALARAGHSTARVAWSDPEVDWLQADAVVLRTPWDWFEHREAFVGWLDRVAERLINPASLVRWNLHKRYLLQLAARGIPIVDTVLLDGARAHALPALVTARGWSEVVVKPALSAGGWNTWRASGAEVPDLVARLASLAGHGPFLVQPFRPEILAAGELSLIVLGGRCTHAVRKRAAPGEFRVQDDHGGTVHDVQLDRPLAAFAERAVRACPQPPTYARVDVVEVGGGLQLMELELVEPELFLRHHPPAAAALAEALDATLRARAPG
jgi:glutathione synthase/RimK-type ligase-like ATP-grasp enzyme